jgi:NAD dependent epimerase/dehydratase family enzyme
VHVLIFALLVGLMLRVIVRRALATLRVLLARFGTFLSGGGGVLQQQQQQQKKVQ